MDENVHRILMSLWDGESEWVLWGHKQYRVLTPEGSERPLFVLHDEGILYGDTSTGMARAPEPHSRRVGRSMPRQASDLGGEG